MVHSDTDLEQGPGQEDTHQMHLMPKLDRGTERELLEAESVPRHERTTTLSGRTLSGITIADPDRKYIVDWDGDHDPDNPLNWSAKKKWRNLVIISSITLIT